MPNPKKPKLGPSQEAKLRQLLDEIKRSEWSVPFEEFEQEYAYTLSVREVLVQLQTLAPPLLPNGTASRLASLDANDLWSASRAMAAIDAIVPTIEDALAHNVVTRGEAQENRTGHCPQCGADRNARVLSSEESVRAVDQDPSGTFLHDVFRILKCLGCDVLYVQKDSHFSPEMALEWNPVTGQTEPTPIFNTTHWPPPTVRSIPDWASQLPDGELRELLSEIYGALDADHRILAAIGTRTAFDRAFVLKGADPNHNFREKQARLRVRGVISEEEQKVLTRLIEAGHAAAHRAWKPDLATLLTLVKGLEAFLYRTLVQAPEVDAASKAVPLRRPPLKRSKPTS